MAWIEKEIVAGNAICSHRSGFCCRVVEVNVLRRGAYMVNGNEYCRIGLSRIGNQELDTGRPVNTYEAHVGASDKTGNMASHTAVNANW